METTNLQLDSNGVSKYAKARDLTDGMQTEIPIAVGINRNYLTPLRIMLSSLANHLSPHNRIVLYLIHCELNAADIDSLSQYAEIRPIKYKHIDIVGGTDYPCEAAIPLFLADVLPELHRILFLDVDLLILDDIAKLWNVDFQGRTVAAVQDGAIPTCGHPRGVKMRARWRCPDNAHYFNCGVLLIDLDRWRERRVTVKALNYLREIGLEVDYIHQEALNAVLWNDWLEIGAHWNMLASTAGRQVDIRHPRYKFKGIVHFAGRIKPWRYPTGGVFGGIYQEYMKKLNEIYIYDNNTLFETIISFYDRRLRNIFYRLEHILWKRRIF